MSEDTIFIKNAEDYEKFSELRPARKYKYRKVKFICSQCNEESIKNFATLSIPFTCRKCTCKIVQNLEQTKTKRKNSIVEKYGVENISQLNEIQRQKEQTCMEHYGVKSPSQVPELKEKMKQTCIERYGVENPLKNQSVHAKQKQTCLERYGVENVSQNENIKRLKENTCMEHYGVKYSMQSDEVKNKSKNTVMREYGVECVMCNPEIKAKTEQTCLERYGVKYFAQAEEVKEKIKNTVQNKYGAEYAICVPEFREKSKNTMLEKYGTEYFPQSIEHKQNLRNQAIIAASDKAKQHNATLLNYSEKNIDLKCNICDNVFSFSRSYFNCIFKKPIDTFCPFCTKIHSKGRSYKEKEIVDYIKNNYNGQLLENDRSILNGKELDIYLPELKLAFEFDGTYWHADHRFYTEDTIIMDNITAKEIWEKDEYKNNLAQSLNIKLIRIKEYDWLNDTDNIKTMILNEIKKTE